MTAYVFKPGSFAAHLNKQSTLQDIQWEVSQSNLNLVATKEVLEKHGVRVEEGLRDVSHRLDDMDRTLVQGVVTLHTDLLAIEGSVRDLSAKFDWGFSRLEAAIGGVQDSLEQLIRLARTPEQTWAYEQFDIARDAFRRALFPEALEHIDRAISGHQMHTGHRLEHRFHHFLGIVRRGDYKNRSPEIVDLAKAEEAYLNACRYAEADHHRDAARALCGAGWVAYCEGAIDRAEAHTKRALEFAELGEANYQLSKIQMHKDAVTPALGHLRKALEADPLYAIRCFDDADFLKHERQVQQLIEELRDALVERCEHVYSVADQRIGLLEAKVKAIEIALAAAPAKGKELAAVAQLSPVTGQIEQARTLAILFRGLPNATPYLDAVAMFARRAEVGGAIAKAANVLDAQTSSIRTRIAEVVRATYDRVHHIIMSQTPLRPADSRGVWIALVVLLIGISVACSGAREFPWKCALVFFGVLFGYPIIVSMIQSLSEASDRRAKRNASKSAESSAAETNRAWTPLDTHLKQTLVELRATVPALQQDLAHNAKSST